MSIYCKYTFLFFILILSRTISAQKEAYSLKFKVSGWSDSTCLLAYYYGDKQYLKDTAKMDATGKFVFDGKEKLAGGIYLVVLPKKNYFEFLLPDENQSFSMETDTSNLVEKMKVKGSTENQLFYEYLNFIGSKQKEAEPIRKIYKRLTDKKDSSSSAKLSEQVKKDSITLLKEKLTKIDEEVTNYKNKFVTDQKNTFVSKVINSTSEIDVPEPPLLPNGKKDSTFAFRYYKAHFFDFIDFSDDRLLRTPVFHNKLKQYMTTLVVQVPDSINKDADKLIAMASANKEMYKYVIWYITNTYETSNIMGMDAVFVHMAEYYYMTGKAYWVDSAVKAKITERAMTLKYTLIGNLAPELKMKDINGSVQSLRSLKSKYTLVVFWDSDCGHCKKTLPELYKTYHKYKDKGFEVFAVNIELKELAWRKFILEKGLTDWINVIDIYHQTNFRKYYDIYSTPVLYLLNENKKIIAKRIGAEQVEELLERYLVKKEEPYIK